MIGTIRKLKTINKCDDQKITWYSNIGVFRFFQQMLLKLPFIDVFKSD